MLEWLEVDPVVGVVEDGSDCLLGTVLPIHVLDGARAGLDVQVVADVSLARLQQHPAVHPPPVQLVELFQVGCIVVDGHPALLLLDVVIQLLVSYFFALQAHVCVSLVSFAFNIVFLCIFFI